MKHNLNEVKTWQKRAGIITESEYAEAITDSSEVQEADTASDIAREETINRAVEDLMRIYDGDVEAIMKLFTKEPVEVPADDLPY